MNRRAKAVESIRDSLKAAREESSRWLEVIGHLEKALMAAEGQTGRDSDSAPESATTPETNLNAVIQIIRNNGGPMRRKEIAQKAFKEGLIRSTRGQVGVDAMVGNILSRSEPRLFNNTGWGWWALAKKAETESELSKPIRFPRVG